MVKKLVLIILSALLMWSIVHVIKTQVEPPSARSDALDAKRKAEGVAEPIEGLKPKAPEALEFYGYPEVAADTTLLGELLEAEHYEDLDKSLSAFQDAFRENFRLEYFVENAFSTFSRHDASWRPMLDGYVKALPGSYAALLARGVYHAHRGWKARGKKWRKDTPDQNISDMNRSFELARADLTAALKLNPGLILAMRELMGMNMGQGHDSKNEILLKQANKVCPYCFSTRRTYLEGLAPRWGGSYLRMKRFLEGTDALLAKNPRLAVLRGLVPADRARSARSNKDYKAAIAHLTEALSHGDYWQFYEDRAEALFWYGSYNQALADANLAAKLRPGQASIHLLRSQILRKLSRYKEASKALQEALKWDPADPEVIDWKENLRRHMHHDGYKATKGNDPKVALQALDEAVRLDPDDVVARINRATNRIKTSDLKGAQEDLEQALTLEPDNFTALKNLVYTYAHQKLWDDALVRINAFLARNPEDGRAYLARGQANYYKRDMKACLADLKKACSLGNTEGCQRHKQIKARAGR